MMTLMCSRKIHLGRNAENINNTLHCNWWQWLNRYITFGTGITLNHIITIVRNIDIERVTDFTGGAAINRAALTSSLINNAITLY